MRKAIAFPILWLLFASACAGKSPDADTREHVISNVRLILKSWDKDRDGRLSRTEVRAMVNESSRRIAQGIGDGAAHPELEAQRQEMLALYASQDTDHDGYLTRDELLKGPLAIFNCMDANHDGKLLKEEVFSGIERCPSAKLNAFTSKR